MSVAASYGHTEALRLLLQCGGDPNRAAYDGWTPVYEATRNGHTKAVRLLEAAGGNQHFAMSDPQCNDPPRNEKCATVKGLCVTVKVLTPRQQRALSMARSRMERRYQLMTKLVDNMV